jgi:hypothetical protein
METRTDVQGGPPLLVPATAFAGLTVAGGVLGWSGPRPGSPAEEVLTYTLEHGTVMGVAAALLLGSMFPLVVYAAGIVSRMRELGVRAPGPMMGLAGAVLAAGFLGISALLGWTAAETAPLADPALASTLATLWFATGGVGFVAPFGLLLLGIAVPALIRRLLPRPLAWATLVVGVLAVLSTFALLTEALYPLLPIGRFGGTLALLAVAALLPTSARRRTEV